MPRLHELPRVEAHLHVVKAQVPIVVGRPLQVRHDLDLARWICLVRLHHHEANDERPHPMQIHILQRARLAQQLTRTPQRVELPVPAPPLHDVVAHPADIERPRLPSIAVLPRHPVLLPTAPRLVVIQIGGTPHRPFRHRQPPLVRIITVNPVLNVLDVHRDQMDHIRRGVHRIAPVGARLEPNVLRRNQVDARPVIHPFHHVVIFGLRLAVLVHRRHACDRVQFGPLLSVAVPLLELPVRMGHANALHLSVLPRTHQGQEPRHPVFTVRQAVLQQSTHNIGTGLLKRIVRITSLDAHHVVIAEERRSRRRLVVPHHAPRLRTEQVAAIAIIVGRVLGVLRMPALEAPQAVVPLRPARGI